MNQRFHSLCRSSSLLRKNPFPRWSPSSRPICFSSSNLIRLFITKLHRHTFNYPSPPQQILGNHHFKKFTGEASQCDFRDEDYLKKEIREVQTKERNVRRSIEDKYGFDDGHSLEGVDDLVAKFNSLMEKLGLATLDGNEKEAADHDDLPYHLQGLRKEIKYLVDSVEMTVAYGEFVAAGGDYRSDYLMENYRCMLKYPEILASLQQMKIRSRLMRELIGFPSPPRIPAGNHQFRRFSEGGEKSNSGDHDHLEKEIWEVRAEQMDVQGDVETGNGPPLDVVKVLADKFNALMEKLGLETLADDYDSDDDDDYPDHLQRFRHDIKFLQKYVDMTVAFGEYVAAGGECCWQPFTSNYRSMIRYEEILASLRKMKIRSRLMRRLIEATSDYQSIA